MPEVLLSNDSLTVLGGPASIGIGLDVGPAGKRGSAIFLSNGDPNIPGNLSQTPDILDLAINVNNLDETYKPVYQYRHVDGVNTWVEVIDLAPGIFAARPNVTFVSGQATIQIPISKIGPFPLGMVTQDELIVTVTTAGSHPQPVVINAYVSGITTDALGQQVLEIVVYGNRWMSTLTGFEPLDGSQTLSVLIQLKTYEPDLTYIP